jgi:hypothetical protein
MFDFINLDGLIAALALIWQLWLHNKKNQSLEFHRPMVSESVSSACASMHLAAE